MGQEISFDSKVRQSLRSKLATIVELRYGYIYNARDGWVWSPLTKTFDYYSRTYDHDAGMGQEMTLAEALDRCGVRY